MNVVQPFIALDSRFTHELTLNVGENSAQGARDALAARFTQQAREIIRDTPKPYQKRLVSTFAGIFNKRIQKDNHEPYRAAKAATAEVKIMARGVGAALEAWRFPLTALYSIDAREREAQNLATVATTTLASFRADVGAPESVTCDVLYNKKLTRVYTQLSKVYAVVGISAPAILTAKKTPITIKNESLESAILRLVCDKWAARKVDRLARRTREQVAIAMGEVGKHSPYVSPRGLTEFRHKQKAAAAFLDNYVLVNEKLDCEISLREAAEAGQSNPVNRRTELMIRANGLQDIAMQENMKAYFLTITAPSKYHPNSAKFEGATPRKTHGYLQECWVLVRALWAKEGIKPKGVRVVEPHKDACPHWHMLVFFPNGQEETALKIARNVFCAEDRHELTNQKTGKEDLTPRFDAKFMTMGVDENGRECSPVSYLAKYISKNVDGFGLENEQDHEAPDHNITDMVQSVTAWARIHGVRQFQFFGLESVTLWREVRRISGTGHGDIANELINATGGRKGDDKTPSWITFTKLVNQHSVALDKVERRSEAYNDKVNIIKGVVIAKTVIQTRDGEWVREFLTASRREALKASGSLRSWTGENNCNQSGGSPDLKHQNTLIFNSLGVSNVT